MNQFDRQEKKLVITCLVVTGVMLLSLLRLMFS